MNQLIVDFQHFYTQALLSADPRTKDRFLVWSNPTTVLVLTLVYVLFVIFGKKYMSQRKEIHVPTWLLFTYNMLLVALSAYMFYELIIGMYQANYNYACEPVRIGSTQVGDVRVANALYIYFVSKAIEFMDTVFMILRKKFNQITFLHVFHHSSMLIIWWICIMWLPGGQSYFGATFNCFIHIWMYLYYGLACIPSMKDKLWWKSYITRMQLIQFVCALAHTSIAFYNGCDYPLWGQYLLSVYMLMLIILFANFYVHAYLVKPKRINKNQIKKIE